MSNVIVYVQSREPAFHDVVEEVAPGAGVWVHYDREEEVVMVEIARASRVVVDGREVASKGDCKP